MNQNTTGHLHLIMLSSAVNTTPCQLLKAVQLSDKKWKISNPLDFSKMETRLVIAEILCIELNPLARESKHITYGWLY